MKAINSEILEVVIQESVDAFDNTFRQDPLVNSVRKFNDQVNELSDKVSELRDAGIETSSVDPIIDGAETAIEGGVYGGLSYALYRAIKEFLTLEGARQRKEISNQEVIKRVVNIAFESAKSGMIVGAILAVAVSIFGSWLLIPLSFIAPFVGVKMTYDLWDVFWKGLNQQQRQELIQQANQVGGKIAQIFNNLENALSSL